MKRARTVLFPGSLLLQTSSLQSLCSKNKNGGIINLYFKLESQFSSFAKETG